MRDMIRGMPREKLLTPALRACSRRTGMDFTIWLETSGNCATTCRSRNQASVAGPGIPLPQTCVSSATIMVARLTPATISVSARSAVKEIRQFGNPKLWGLLRIEYQNDACTLNDFGEWQGGIYFCQFTLGNLNTVFPRFVIQTHDHDLCV